MFYYDSRPLNEDLNVMVQRREANTYEQMERSRMFAESLQEERELKRKKEVEYEQFLLNVKDTLLTEGIFYFVNESLPEDTSIESRLQAEAAVYNFVKQEDANKLLKKYEEKTQFLAEFAHLIQKTYKSILENTNANNCSCKIKQSSTDEFYGKLRNMNVDQACKVIHGSVAKEVEDFVKQQVEDKNRIEQLAQDTKEKIDNVKAKTQDAKEEIKQEMAALYKRESQNIRYKRPRSLFEELNYKIAEKAITDKNISKSFCESESGKFDFAEVLETTTTLFTVLETMNVLKFKTFDANTINTIVNNL